MPVWYSDKSADPGARMAWLGFIKILILAHSVTSGRSFNISDFASVKGRVAWRISKNVCKSPNTVSGTYYALNQRLIFIAAVVVNAKDIGLKTGNRFVLLRSSVD